LFAFQCTSVLLATQNKHQKRKFRSEAVVEKVNGRSKSKRDIALKAILVLGVIVLVCRPSGRSAVAASGHHFKFCHGYFALCAASTCTPTGDTVTVNVIGGGTAEFPEADCVCPIFYGRAIADVNGGMMSGSCAPPSTDGLWSIYSKSKFIPQAINGWAQAGPAALAPKQICPASLNLGDESVNCFGFVCDSETFTNGVPVATCHCALGESFEGTAVAPHTAFWTNAGQRDQSICDKYPAAVPISAQRRLNAEN
jgi:hypothetical protein